jgi:hypothetical protein
MLTFYCDDSGTNYKTPFCVLAGYIGPAEEWQQFSDEWCEELEQSPSIRFLKMSQAHSVRGEFLDWSIQERDEKLERLAAVIRKRNLSGIASMVSNEAYKSFVRDFLPKTINHPYWLCFQGILDGVFRFTSDDERINMVLDRQGEGYQRAAHFIHSYLADPLVCKNSDRVGSLSFEDGDVLAPLQAAEMLVWYMRDHADSRSIGKPTSRRAAQRLWEMETVTKIWNGRLMEQYVETYQALHPLSPVNRPDLYRINKQKPPNLL